MKTKTWIYWVLLHFISFPIALTLGFIAIHLLAFVGAILPEIVASGLGYMMWAAIIGLVFGFLQWRFLKTVEIPKGWIWKSALGFGIAETLMVIVLLCFGIDRNIDLIFSYGMEIWTTNYLIGGGISGYLQMGYLKPLTKFYKYWGIGNALIWGIGTFVWTSFIKFQVLGNIAVFLGGLSIGLLSAVTLHYFLDIKPSQGH